MLGDLSGQERQAVLGGNSLNCIGLRDRTSTMASQRRGGGSLWVLVYERFQQLGRRYFFDHVL